jgi:hypothetical protein
MKNVYLSVALVAWAACVNSARAELVAHWTFNDATNGIKNVGTNGALSDLNAVSLSDGINIMTMPTFHATGGYDGGGYASFDGINQGLTTFQVGNAAEALSDFPFTLTAWIKPTGQVGDLRATAYSLTRTASSSTYYRMSMGYAADDVHPGDFEVIRSNTTVTPVDVPNTFGTLTNGSWHHAAVVFAAADQVQAYLDGVAVGTTDPTSPGTVTFNNLVNAVNFGLVYRRAQNGGFTDWWKGSIDDPRLYNTALTAQEVQAIFNPSSSTPDYNGNSAVDAADYVLWRKSPDMFGGTPAGYDAWRAAFGTGAGLGTATVPEPGSMGLAVLAMAALFVARRPTARVR